MQSANKATGARKNDPESLLNQRSAIIMSTRTGPFWRIPFIFGADGDMLSRSDTLFCTAPKGLVRCFAGGKCFGRYWEV